jgi:hypothetical protein
MKRGEVEAGLRQRNVEFQQMCCLASGDTMADLVELGKEKPTFFFCTDRDVIAAFRFAPTEPSPDPLPVRESDRLVEVRYWDWERGCFD